MQMSKLHIYSYGVVAVNKSRSSHEIEVNPIEATSMLEGELTSAVDEEKAKGVDASGASFEAKANVGATLTARWLPMGSNRKTPPDVRRGEKVAIYRFGDADKYYWASLEYEAKLRKLETVIYAFSNTQVEDEDATDSNTYFFEISTHDKVIRLHTSVSDGEPFGYDLVLNTKDGVFSIKDTIDNLFLLDSGEHQMVLMNADDCSLEINKEDLNINVPGNMTINVGKNFVHETGGNFIQKVLGVKTSDITGTTTLNCKSNILYTSPDDMKIDTPDVLATGNITSSKKVVVGTSLSTGASGGKGSGDSVINGNIRIDGKLDVSGYLTSASGASFSSSVSAPNI